VPDSATIMKWAGALGGALLIVLQSVNVEQTSVVATEAERVEQEQSKELQAIQAMQNELHVLLDTVRNNQKWGQEGLGRIQEKLGIPVPAPTPQ